MTKIGVWKRKMAKREKEKERDIEASRKIALISLSLKQDLVEAGYYS